MVSFSRARTSVSASIDKSLPVLMCYAKIIWISRGLAFASSTQKLLLIGDDYFQVSRPVDIDRDAIIVSAIKLGRRLPGKLALPAGDSDSESWSDSEVMQCKFTAGQVVDLSCKTT